MMLMKLRPGRPLRVIRKTEDFFRSVSGDLRGHRPRRRHDPLAAALVDGDGVVGRSLWPGCTFQLRDRR